MKRSGSLPNLAALARDLVPMSFLKHHSAGSNRWLRFVICAMPSTELFWANTHIFAAAAGALVIGAAVYLLSRSKSSKTKSDLIRGNVGKSSDFKEGEPRAVKIEGAKNQVLVVRHGGRLHAVGNKCPHAGAALNTGVFSCGRIVCPLHGASFDVTTGEIEDSGPCLNQVLACPLSCSCSYVAQHRHLQLPTFEVTLEGDDVIVCGSASVIDAKVHISFPLHEQHTKTVSSRVLYLPCVRIIAAINDVLSSSAPAPPVLLQPKRCGKPILQGV